MEIIADKALLLDAADPELVLSLLPKSKEVEEGILVKWGLNEASKLAQLGMDVPSPILRDYNWSGKLTPFAHQKTTASFLSLREKAFCFSDPGTGKTASVIWAADYLMKQKVIQRVLVVCPLSIMQAAWQQDLFKFAMHRSCGVAHGTAGQRKKVIQGGAEFVVINFDGVATVRDEIVAGGFDLVVVDECFVAGTTVHTPMGPRAIETLKAGDLVYTSNGVAHIRTTKRRESVDIVKVSLEDGETITCTGDHPFFTDAGWVVARNLVGRRLVSKADLSDMRGHLQSEPGSLGMAPGERNQQVSDLLAILRAEEVAYPQSGEVLLLEHAAGAAGEVHGVCEIAGGSRAYICEPESSRAQTTCSWGQRYGHDSCGNGHPAATAGGLGMELPCSIGEEAARLSYELQARLREPRAETGLGSRWSQSQSNGPASARQEERSQIGGVRVESVSDYEQGSPTTVFNLEVAGTPNFFVGGGWLTHNCSAYKNPQTKRWKVLKKLVVATNARLWMLTGTPAAQSPLDAYGLAKMLDVPGCPKFYTAYRDSVMTQASRFKWVPKPGAQAKVHKLLQPAIRFEKKDCLDLPEVLFTERHAPLTTQQMRYYKVLKDQMLFEAGGEEVSAVNAASKINKLLQISGGAVYTDTGEVLEFDIRNRMNVVLEAIEETSNKVLVFVPFTHTIGLLKDKLDNEGISCEVINGAVPVTKRGDIVSRFQRNPDPRVLLIQPQAASHGLTLTAADTIIWYAPVTSVETYLQANARIDRPGQKNAMTIVHIKGSPVEERLYQMLQAKVKDHAQLVDLYRSVITE